MKKEKIKVNIDDLASEVDNDKKKPSKIKRFAKWFVLNSLLIPVIISTYKGVANLAKSSFPVARIETYEEAIKRNNFTQEDIERGYRQNKNFRNFFALLSFLLILYIVINVEGKIEIVIYLLGLLNLVLLTLKHDLRVWQVENKTLCKFDYYLIQRFFKFNKKEKI